MMSSSSGTVRNLYFYPVKGLSPQPLPSVNLAPGEGFPFDRMFGLACFDSGFDPSNPRPLPKQRFLMLARDNRLAELQTYLDPHTKHFTIHVQGERVHESDFSHHESIEKTRDWFAGMFGVGSERRPILAEAAPHRFTDVSVASEQLMNAISLINLSSVSDFSKRVGKPIDPLRFRANLYFEGWAPFSELELMNRELNVGSARLRILRRTTRCAATEVDPKNGQRDIAVPRLLKECYGHLDMGVYAQVLTGGVVEPGMPVEIRN